MTPDTPAGGAVACHRTVTGNGEAWMWVTGMPSLGALDNLKVHPTWRIEYAYTQPPATVSADAVLALVERLKDRVFPDHECPAESAAVWNVALYTLRDELEALTREATK